jgi:hypothetical protein
VKKSAVVSPITSRSWLTETTSATPSIAVTRPWIAVSPAAAASGAGAPHLDDGDLGEPGSKGCTPKG